MKIKGLGLAALVLIMLGVSGCKNTQDVMVSADEAAVSTEEANTAFEYTTEEVEEVTAAEESAIAPESTESTQDSGSEEETTLSETETETVVQVEESREVVITFTGDCSLGKLSIHGYEGTFYEMYDLKGPGYFFQNVKQVFENDDMTLINFEGVLTTSNEITEKEYNIKGEPEYIQILTEGSVEAASFGNNHRIDYGEQGVADTVAAFNGANVAYAYDKELGYYETEDGVLIGFVSVNEVYDETLVEEYLREGIATLRQDCDLVIACCHWGEELHHYPDAYQKQLGRMCIDWGADIVVGNHPHVLQGIDYYNGKYIIYSLGNFCFGGNKNPKDKNSMIVQMSVALDKDGTYDETRLQVIPCRISSVSSRNDYCPTIVDGEKRDTILGLVNEYSRDFNVSVDGEGRVIYGGLD